MNQDEMTKFFVQVGLAKLRKEIEETLKQHEAYQLRTEVN